MQYYLGQVVAGVRGSKLQLTCRLVLWGTNICHHSSLFQYCKNRVQLNNKVVVDNKTVNVIVVVYHFVSLTVL